MSEKLTLDFEEGFSKTADEFEGSTGEEAQLILKGLKR